MDLLIVDGKSKRAAISGWKVLAFTGALSGPGNSSEMNKARLRQLRSPYSCPVRKN
jgi:hypothetical protein